MNIIKKWYLPTGGLTTQTGISPQFKRTTSSAIAFVKVYVFGHPWIILETDVTKFRHCYKIVTIPCQSILAKKCYWVCWKGGSLSCPGEHVKPLILGVKYIYSNRYWEVKALKCTNN